MTQNLQIEQNNKITQYCTLKLRQTKTNEKAVTHSEITHPVVAYKATVKIVQSGPATQHELFCILCMSNATCEKLPQVERHRATMKHVSATGAILDQNKKVTLMQQLLPVVSKDFMTELVKTFLAADIPLHKLRNPHVIQLFENLGQKMQKKLA